jgi:hypothetical protein
VAEESRAGTGIEARRPSLHPRKRRFVMRTIRNSGIALAVALLALSGAPATVTAQTADECEVLMMDGETLRSCTLTESFGQCLEGVLDSYEQCKEVRPGFWEGLLCLYAATFDSAECIVDLIESLLPFSSSTLVE